MYKTKTIILKEKSPLKQDFDEQAHLAKLFKNSVIFRYRQLMFAQRKDFKDLTEHEKQVLDEFKKTEPNYRAISNKYYLPTMKHIDNMFKITKNSDYYSELPRQCTQQIIKEVRSDFKSYFNSCKKYKQDNTNYTGRPQLPKYNKNDVISYDITNQDAVIYKKKNESYELKLPKIKKRLDIGNEEITKLKEVTIKPFYNTYKICLVYEVDDPNPKKLDENRILSIDLGINNFLTTSNNVGLNPFIINGKIMKSKNQFFNKKLAYLKSKLPKGQYNSKQLQRLYKKRNNYFETIIHKISHYILEYCTSNNIGTIVIGHSKLWKQEINIGDKNNQTFCYFPHSSFIKKLKEKAVNYGVNVIEREESYTSKASFLDMDNIPTYKENNNEEYIFSGKRIKRGLYKSKKGIIINADVNGASNILRKEFPNAFKNITDFSYLYKTVEKITIEKRDKNIKDTKEKETKAKKLNKGNLCKNK